MRRIFFVGLVAVLLLQASCQTKAPKYKTPLEIAKDTMVAGVKANADDQKKRNDKTLPVSVKNALMPKVGDSDTAHNTLYNKKFTIRVDNISALVFFNNMRKATNNNIVVDPKITGNISLDLKDVTIPQIFQAVRDNYGYEYTKTSFGFEVTPPQLQSRLFRVNYLDIKRSSTSKTSLASSDLIDAGAISSTNNSDGSESTDEETTRSGSVTNSVETTSSIAFWDSLSESLKTLIGADGGRSITVNADSGVVVVKAFPNELRQVREFIDRMQSSMNRQVVLEVSILEVRLDDAFQAGINWHLLGLVTDMGTVGVSGDVPYTTVTATSGSNEAVISLLKQQGNVEVLSNPRVLTVNNQQSIIKVGSESYYVTGITNTPYTNSDGTSTTSTSVALTPFFSGLTLNITPQIDYNAQILLHVHPTVSVVKSEDTTINVGTDTPMVLPLATETLREYDSIVRASNNQVIVIGGMITNNLQESVASTPGLGSIPFLGSLFRMNTQTGQKWEMVLILKPLLVTEHPRELSDQYNATKQRIEELDRGFHDSALTDMFGNKAETF